MRIDLRAKDLKAGDVCLGSGIRVVETRRSATPGKIAIGYHAKDGTLVFGHWGKTTSIAVDREPAISPNVNHIDKD